MKILDEMTCSAEEKKSLPVGLQKVDEGKLTFFSSKFTFVLIALDKRIREILTEKNQKRYPKTLMRITKKVIYLDEELCGMFCQQLIWPAQHPMR